MKDEELKLEEIQSSHTRDGSGEVVRGDGIGEGVDDTLMSNTLGDINFANSGITCQVGLR